MHREKLSVSNRAVLHNSKAAMHNDVIAGLIELILNSDDSLYRLEAARSTIDNRIFIHVKRGRGTSSYICVEDFAEGLTKKKIDEILVYGESTSDFGVGGVRGFFGRGMKDAIIGLGEYGIISSVKNGEITVYKIYSNTVEKELIYEGKATSATLKKYKHDNGVSTRVEIKLKKEVAVSHFDNLRPKIQNNYLLRKVVCNPNRQLFLNKWENTNGERLYLKPMEGKVLWQQSGVRVEGYLAVFDILIQQAPEPLSQHGSERMGGLLITNGNAIHDCSLFGYDDEPAASHLFGEVCCPYIDTLLKNEEMIIKLDRSGIDIKHEFGNALIKAIKRILDPVVKDLIKKAQAKEDSDMDNTTKEKFKKAVSEMNKIAKGLLNLDKDIDDDDYEHQLPEKGFGFIPPISSPSEFEVGEEGSCYLRIQCPLHVPSYETITLKVSDSGISIKSETLNVCSGTKLEDGLYQHRIDVKGVSIGEYSLEAEVVNVKNEKLTAAASIKIIN